MCDTYNLERFVEAQKSEYDVALREIREGCKRSHWIWFVFPQMASLGFSYNARFYGISCIDEARAYLAHPILGKRLRQITEALLQHKDKDVLSILGAIDTLKVCSCMTLFDVVSPDDVFRQVLETFYDDKRDAQTLALVRG
ncbi:MAG: DUF1810 domain-containing protein [Anaerobiospirillum succiniciproducens]|uniref:DUF1810 domain-containing protein n=1 Tax=Anaerobiospirillum succiniciproducens TaxID=13335 RepID=UPI002A74737C|nr:DUF1810 domain-containing protein [Anaerobiospirillum succiniciproducens]MDY2797622.1 DUF1810 domain-containing protein [Anaerobiospirillum succiniciproducens]